MTTFLEAPPARSASLTTSQLETVRRVWGIAGLPPTSGYGTSFLALAVATDPNLAAALTTVDLDNADSVMNVVAVLLKWRQRAFHPTS